MFKKLFLSFVFFANAEVTENKKVPAIQNDFAVKY